MKTELAKLIKEDGQPIRAIHGYLIDVMEDVKGLKFDTHQDVDPMPGQRKKLIHQ